jgi:ubiquinone/menaquinone biosynthesis C-methylase UbiE
MNNPRNDFFRRLLIDSGIKEGMRVLDVGCGTGELSVMASTLMGDTGEVIGFDISQDALATAEKALSESGLSTVRFIQSDIVELSDTLGAFDMIVGRRVLMYQNSAAQSIKALLPFLADDGKMVFEESDRIATPLGSPQLPLHTKVRDWIWDTVAREGGNTHMGMQLYTVMRDAGLSVSVLRSEAILHTYESGSDLGWVARMMAARMIKHGVVTREELDIETLEDRLQEERKNANAPFIRDMTFGICAELWCRYGCDGGRL